MNAKKPQQNAGLVSRVDQAAVNLRRLKGTPQEFLSELAATPGVKKTELEARGLNDPNALPKQPIKRQDFNRLLGTHPHAAPHVTINHAGDPETEDADPEGFRQWTLPGGKDYREMLFQHPHKEGAPFIGQHYSTPDVLAHARLVDRTGPNGEKVLHVEEIQSDWHQKGRKHGYRNAETTKMFDSAVKAAHAAKRELTRAKDDVLLAELQDDPSARNAAANRVAELTGPALRTQAEFEDVRRDIGKRVPDAPWKKDWHEMVLRHLLKHAVDNDYDALAVTPGEEQAKRYDLSKRIASVEYYPGQERLLAYNHKQDRVVDKSRLEPHELGAHIGEELAKKLMAVPPDRDGIRTLRGQDVRVGGEGMKGFYDRMVPIAMNKLGKPYGAQVGTMALRQEPAPLTTGHVLDDLARRGHSQERINNMRAADLAAHQRLMEAERDAQPVPTVNLHALPITDKMREDVKANGLPLFAKGGEVDAEKNLQAFLADSKVKDRMYHGTNKDFARFRRPLHGNFVSPDPEFANQFARTEGGNMMPVYVRATNPWDFDNPEHMAAMKRAAVHQYPARHSAHATLDAIGYDGDNWSHIEHPNTQDLIKGLGHDAYYTREGGVKHLAVYDPRNIKSAIGNQGTYDPESADIRKAQGGTVQTQNSLITTLAQRLGMTPAQVMQAIQQQQQPQGLAEGGQPDKKRKKKKDGRLSLSDLLRLSNVGAEEAPDLPIKEFTGHGHSMIPEGGVQMPNGAPFPIGPQQQVQPAQSQTGIPGQVQGGAPLAAIASMLHQGPAGAPQPGQQPGQGNMLALTHQGQAMQAMKPPMPQPPVQRPMPPRPGMPAMAKGGKVKMSTADMRRALEARKRTAK